MKNKHEQLYVAVQDLLIELDVTPKKLRFIADRSINSPTTFPGSKITAKTAQKLIDADLVVEEINWRKSENEVHTSTTRNFPLSKFDKALLMFDEIKPNLSSMTIFDKIKSGLAPGILWSYLREEYPEVLLEQIKDYLFPSS